MTQQEINYFLDGVSTKQELIESIEALRTELRTAMAPMMEPVYKKTQTVDLSAWDSTNFLLSRDCLSPAQKIIVMWMEHNTKFNEWTQFSIQAIADGTRMSRKHIRESLLKLKEMGVVRHSCEKNKWYMPDDFAMELGAYELNNEI